MLPTDPAEQKLGDNMATKREFERRMQTIVDKARQHEPVVVDAAAGLLQLFRTKFGAVAVKREGDRLVVKDFEPVCAEGSTGCNGVVFSDHYPDGEKGYVSWHNDALWIAPEAKPGDGYAPFAVFEAMMIGGSNPPEKTVEVVSRLINATTDGAYRQAIDALAARVRHKQESSLVHGGATFVRFQPSLEALLGVRPTSYEAREQFMGQVLIDLNVALHPGRSRADIVRQVGQASHSREAQDFMNAVPTTGSR